jgi:hypothetical protein
MTEFFDDLAVTPIAADEHSPIVLELLVKIIDPEAILAIFSVDTIASFLALQSR